MVEAKFHFDSSKEDVFISALVGRLTAYKEEWSFDYSVSHFMHSSVTICVSQMYKDDDYFFIKHFVDIILSVGLRYYADVELTSLKFNVVDIKCHV